MRKRHRNGLVVRLALVSTFALFASDALAVDGVVVNTRNGTDSLQYYGTIDGELWRHDIVGDVVIASSKIYDGPASRPAISPDGSRVAFIKATGVATGKIAMINIDGTGEIELVDCLRNSLVDFPDNQWVYFTLGGYHESTSGDLKRVDVNTRVVDPVMQVKGRSGSNTRIAQIQISGDLTRAVIRSGDSESDPAGEIVALSLTDDDRLDQTLGTQYSCAGGFFADGQYVMDGNGAHDGFDIHLYSDASVVKTFQNTDAFNWPPNSGAGNPGDLNHAIFNTGGATNSDRWMNIVTGGTRDYKWDSMMLFNWKDERCIFVTRGMAGPWDHGDFWVGVPDTPTDTTPPFVITASTQSGVDNQVTVTYSEVVTAATVEVAGNYGIDSGVTVSAAVQPGSGDAIVLTTSTLSTGTYTLTVNNVEDLAGNVIATNSQIGFSYSAAGVNQAPLVNAGADEATFVGAPTTLVGSASDDGLPVGSTMTTAWTVTAGAAAAVQFGDAASPVTTVTFSAEGGFTLRLTADDGDLQAFDEADVMVAAQQSITLVSPVGGEQWPVGSTQMIQWTTVSVDDVMILFSSDDGATWATLASTVDSSSSSWGSFPWTVPDTPTDVARITVDAYLRGSVTPPTSEPFSIVVPTASGGPTGDSGTDVGGTGDLILGGCACHGSGGNGGGLWMALALLGLGLRCRRS